MQCERRYAELVAEPSGIALATCHLTSHLHFKHAWNDPATHFNHVAANMVLDKGSKSGRLPVYSGCSDDAEPHGPLPGAAPNLSGSGREAGADSGDILAEDPAVDDPRVIRAAPWNGASIARQDSEEVSKTERNSCYNEKGMIKSNA